MKRVAAALVVSVALFGAMPAGAVTVKTALIYGDSLTLEAKPTVLARFAPHAQWRPIVTSIPGVALCEYVAHLSDDLAANHPTVVTVETHGGMNSPTTGCFDQSIVRDSPEYWAKYRDDLDGVFSRATAAGAKVVYFATPPDKTNDLEQTTMTTLARTEAGHYHGVSIANSGRSALGGNTWRSQMTCLTIEKTLPSCVAGKITVRAPDNVHFCPAGYIDFWAFYSGCTVYSSGAFRYGRAMYTATVAPPKPIQP